MKEKTDPRYVKFDYFQVKISDRKSLNAKKAHVSFFDLTKWMDLIRPKYESNPETVTMNYSGEQIRCDEAVMDGVGTQNPFAHLHFTKLREKNVPAVGSLNNVKLENVTLKDNEYIAEDVSALFDPSNFILMLQKNIYSLSRGALTEYINFFWNQGRQDKDKQYIQLMPIFEKNTFSKGKSKNNFKKITFKTANKTSSASFTNPFQGLIGKTFESLKPLKGLNIEVTISASKKQNDFLDRTNVIQLINEIETRKTLVKDATVTVAEKEYGTGREFTTTYIDLMDGKVQSKLLFDVPRKEKLDENAVWSSMIGEYRSDGVNMQQTVNQNIL